MKISNIKKRWGIACVMMISIEKIKRQTVISINNRRYRGKERDSESNENNNNNNNKALI